MQQKSDKQQLKKEQEEETCSELPSPDINPPPYDSVRNEKHCIEGDKSKDCVTIIVDKNFNDDCQEMRDETTSPLLASQEQSTR